jgi:hypothetical protein
MWYKLLIAYLLAFPALITGLYLGDRAWRSSYGRRLRRSFQPPASSKYRCGA